MKNFKHFIILFVFLAGSLALFAQATKPSIMIVPSLRWCDEHGYVQTYDNQGLEETLPDYKKAFLKDSELSQVIIAFQKLMLGRGYKTIDLEATLNSLSSQSAQNAMLNSKSGASVSESPYDKLLKTAKADIIVEMSWKIYKNGPKQYINYTLKGLDAYTNEPVAEASGTGSEASITTPLSILLEEAVLANMDEFSDLLMSHFEDMVENGRTVTLDVQCFDSFNGDLETEYDGKELGVIIEDWVADNTVNGVFGLDLATENFMNFRGVRIPLFTEKDGKTRAVTTRNWSQNLQSYLKTTYQIEAKVITQGLGKVILMIGEK